MPNTMNIKRKAPVSNTIGYSCKKDSIYINSFRGWETALDAANVIVSQN